MLCARVHASLTALTPVPLRTLTHSPPPFTPNRTWRVFSDTHWPLWEPQGPMERGTTSYGWSFHNYWAGKLINSLIILKQRSEFLKINLFYLMPQIQPWPWHSTTTKAQWDAGGAPELTGQDVGGGGCLGGCRPGSPFPSMGTQHSKSWE